MNRAPRRKTRWALLIAMAVIAVALGGRRLLAPAAEPISSEKSPPRVTVARARTLDLPIKFQTQGHVVPINRVDVRAQVAGIVRSVDFREGDDVQAGQRLFTLDASTENAQLSRARAQAAQIEAELEDARRNYRRSTELVGAGYVSASAVDATGSKVKMLEAQLKAAQAEVESARVQVGHTRIVAPISARAGEVRVHPGSLAQAGDAQALVSLVQLDPIAVEFDLQEKALGGLLTAQAAGLTAVSVTTADGRVLEGKLAFIDNTVDTRTGTVHLKAHLPNATRQLWPGAFVRTTLRAGVERGAVVLPPQAVLEGPQGHFVYRVDGSERASLQPVTLLRIQDGHAVVAGLDDGQRVAVEGIHGLDDGMAVTVVEDFTTATAATPADRDSARVQAPR